MSAVKQVQITFDCADPRALSLFWCEVLGYVFPAPPPGFESWDAFSETLPEAQRNSASACVDPDGVGPRLFFQQVPEGKAAKNRVHLDVRAAPGLVGDDRMTALEAECERLVALGASRQRRFEPDPPMSNGFVVMQDPEGNEFCLD
ncbi:VOC family protein [Nocardioides sp. YIM 152315]|uniref:VOC family protein n=1 Tax=Nocardioides sp. YIM 152315 TaxID=3031760 RepID=UPI0023DC6A86|nr:VOC family protein [Nocardioides sp. YIM 152315]MDF1601949.1 VOC family protein [Nocardioides sp. YIM 152315]